MSTHEWFIENRAGFALRTLDPQEERAFADHLRRCEDCAAAVADLGRDLRWLSLGVSPVASPPGLERRVLEGTLSHRARRRWLAPAAVAASLTLATGAWSLGHSQVDRLHRQLAERERRVVALEDTLTALFGAERVLQQTIARSGHVGGILIFYDHDTDRWNVVVHDLPPAPPGQAYQLWVVTTQGPVRGPQLHPHGRRPTFLALNVPPPSEVVGAELTLEKSGASSQRGGVTLASLEF